MVTINQLYDIGTVIDRRYKIIGHVGQGGMGGIYLGEHLQFKREVAIKVLLESSRTDESSRHRFVTEARAVCHLQHPNLVTYHDFGIDPVTNRLYLVMERLVGKSLSDVVKRQSPLPLTRVVHILTQLCDALAVAHDARVIHRDLKPANVMLVRRGEDVDWVKLIDFGIVRVLDEVAGSRRLTAEGMIIGTSAYLAPEYIQKQIVDQRTDIYALGVMAYEMIAGFRPFQHKDRTKLLLMHLTHEPTALTQLEDGRDVSAALNSVVLRALAKDPKRRIQSVRDFKARLLSAARPLLDSSSSTPTLAHMQALGSEVTTRQERPFSFPAVAGSERLAPLSNRPPPRITDTGLQSGLTTIQEPKRGRSVPVLASAFIGLVTAIGVLAWIAWDRSVPTHTLVSHSGEQRDNLVMEALQLSQSRMGAFQAAVELPMTLIRRPQALYDRRQRRKDIEEIPLQAGQIKAKHRVDLKTEPSADIYYRNQKIGRTHARLMLPVGRHCFEARNSNWGTKESCISVKAHESNRFKITLGKIK